MTQEQLFPAFERRLLVAAIVAADEPVRGPLDAPASLAHVADVRRWIATWERSGKPGELRQAAAARRDLAAHGFAACRPPPAARSAVADIERSAITTEAASPAGSFP